MDALDIAQTVGPLTTDEEKSKLCKLLLEADGNQAIAIYLAAKCCWWDSSVADLKDAIEEADGSSYLALRLAYTDGLIEMTPEEIEDNDLYNVCVSKVDKVIIITRKLAGPYDTVISKVVRFAGQTFANLQFMLDEHKKEMIKILPEFENAEFKIGIYDIQ